MLNDECLEMINEWFYYNDKLRKINNYLYKHTELFEQKYMSEYKESLYNEFAKKITRYTKDENEIKQKLTQKEIEKLNKIKLLKRG